MEIKEAMEIYFEKQLKYWQSEYGTYPERPYREEINEIMIIENSLDSENYIQWKPVKQDKSIDFSKLESKLNITINSKIKQFFSSYWFLSMIGDIGDIQLHFISIPYGINVLDLIERYYNYGKRNFPDNIYFGLGIANVDDDDSYLIYVDNETTIVKCVQVIDNVSIELGTLEKVILEMEAGE